MKGMRISNAVKIKHYDVYINGTYYIIYALALAVTRGVEPITSNTTVQVQCRNATGFRSANRATFTYLSIMSSITTDLNIHPKDGYSFDRQPRGYCNVDLPLI